MRLDACAQRRKGRVGLRHVDGEDLRRADGGRWIARDLGAQPQPGGHLGDGLDSHVIPPEPDGDHVAGFPQALADRHAALEGLVEVLRQPRFAAYLHVGEGGIDHHVRGRDPALDRRGIDERLERRARLAQRLGGAIELGVREVAASDHRQHLPGRRIQDDHRPLHIRGLEGLGGFREFLVVRMLEPGALFDPLEPPLHGLLGEELNVRVERGPDHETCGVQLAAVAVVQDLPDPFFEVRRHRFPVPRGRSRKRGGGPPFQVARTDEALLRHAPQNQVAPGFCRRRIEEWVVSAGTVRDGRQESRFRRVCLRGRLAQILLRGSLDTVHAIIVDLIHVGFQNLVLRIGTLQFQRHLRLLELAQEPLFEADVLIPDVARQLLRERASPALVQGSSEQHVAHRARDAERVHTAVAVEALVLHGDKGPRDVAGQRADGNRGPPLDAELLDEPAVAGEQLGGLARLPAMDLGDGGTVDTQVPPGTPHEAAGEPRTCEQGPGYRRNRDECSKRRTQGFHVAQYPGAPCPDPSGKALLHNAAKC